MNIKTIFLIAGLALNLQAEEKRGYSKTLSPGYRCYFVGEANFFSTLEASADGSKKIDMTLYLHGYDSNETSISTLYQKSHSNTKSFKKLRKSCASKPWHKGKKRLKTAEVFVKDRSDQNNYVQMRIKAKGRRGGFKLDRPSPYDAF